MVSTDTNILAIADNPGTQTPCLYSVYGRWYAGISTESLLTELENRGIAHSGASAELWGNFTQLATLT